MFTVASRLTLSIARRSPAVKSAPDDRHRLRLVRIISRKCEPRESRCLASPTRSSRAGWLLYPGQPWHPQVEFIARVLRNREGKPWIMPTHARRDGSPGALQPGSKRLEEEDEWGMLRFDRRAAWVDHGSTSMLGRKKQVQRRRMREAVRRLGRARGRFHRCLQLDELVHGATGNGRGTWFFEWEPWDSFVPADGHPLHVDRSSFVAAPFLLGRRETANCLLSTDGTLAFLVIDGEFSSCWPATLRFRTPAPSAAGSARLFRAGSRESTNPTISGPSLHIALCVILSHCWPTPLAAFSADQAI